ncbi:OLC1v1035799C1 [Oldenlandia corymbosa var. corymbosa]|uniref:OLC1v1035799C1 n=1 Tax=Oldenlandia corymbosa var. corymbosa TaxID=529605 RepID=A0AAV1CUZ5_OLDCO|nr:OLC1v1035799C1 [Oldenlandia corymbosa var. corymbosa]
MACRKTKGKATQPQVEERNLSISENIKGREDVSVDRSTQKRGTARVPDLQSEELARIGDEIQDSSVNRMEAVKENSNLTAPAKLQWSEMVERDEKQGVWAKNDTSKFKAPSEKLQFIPPKEVAGQNIAQMQMEDVKTEAEYWESSIACFVLGAHPPIGVTERYFQKLWGNLGIDKPLIVKPWEVEKGINYNDVEYVPIWIRLYGLEVKFWNLNSLSRLVSAIGTPILADDYIVRKERVQFARILVEMKIAANVPDKLVFEDEKGHVKVQKIVYEWLPTKCDHCSEYGHLTTKCIIKLRKEEDKPKQPVATWKKVENKVEGRRNAAKTIATDDNQRNSTVRRKDQSSCEVSFINSNGQLANSLHEEGNLEKKKGGQSGEDENMVKAMKSRIWGVQEENGREITDQKGIEEHFVCFFRELLGKTNRRESVKEEMFKTGHVLDAKLWNKAALLKQVWQIASQKDALWIKWIHGVYLKSSSFWEVEAKSDASWQWKQLLKVRDHGKLGFAGSSWLASATGKYTVKLGYAWFTGNEMKVRESQSIWSRMNVPKHSFIAWLTWKKRLWTKDKLISMHMVENDQSCLLCKLQLESVEHLFFQCNFAAAVLAKIVKCLGCRKIAANEARLRMQILNMWKG